MDGWMIHCGDAEQREGQQQQHNVVIWPVAIHWLVLLLSAILPLRHRKPRVTLRAKRYLSSSEYMNSQTLMISLFHAENKPEKKRYAIHY